MINSFVIIKVVFAREKILQKVHKTLNSLATTSLFKQLLEHRGSAFQQKQFFVLLKMSSQNLEQKQLRIFVLFYFLSVFSSGCVFLFLFVFWMAQDEILCRFFAVRVDFEVFPSFWLFSTVLTLKFFPADSFASFILLLLWSTPSNA